MIFIDFLKAMLDGLNFMANAEAKGITSGLKPDDLGFCVICDGKILEINSLKMAVLRRSDTSKVMAIAVSMANNLNIPKEEVEHFMKAVDKATEMDTNCNIDNIDNPKSLDHDPIFLKLLKDSGISLN